MQKMRADAGIGCKRDDDVSTPEDLLVALREEFGSVLFDPCPLRDANATDETNYTDGLSLSWADGVKECGAQWVFCNPPYSKTKKWVEKAVLENTQNGVQTIMLIPARTQRRYWFELVYPNATEIRFIQGGLKFGSYTIPAPFGSALIFFGKTSEEDSRTNRTIAMQMGKYDVVSI